MSKLKFNANISLMFADVGGSILSRYSAAKESGFKAVECAFPYDIPKEDLARSKADAGLDQILLNTFPGSSLGFAALAGWQAEFMDSLERSIEYCRELDCKRLHIMSGKVSESTPGSEEILRQNLTEAVPLLEKAGIVGLIEPINPYWVPGYFLNDFDAAERVVKSVNSPNVRLMLDIFHLQYLKGDLTNSLKKFLPITGHIQVAQVPDRHEPNSPGEINYKYVFDVLEKSSYDGWIGLEYIPEADTGTGLRCWLDEFGYSL